MNKGLLLAMCLVFVISFSCKRKGSSVITDYTYVGTTTALWENVVVSGQSINTTAWDSIYPDKVLLYQEPRDSTLTFTISSQNHKCQSFQESFTFPKNYLDTYTANSNTLQASHSFEIHGDSLYGYMLKYEGVDTNHTNFQLSFKGKVIQ
jgi:hypothetical protein